MNNNQKSVLPWITLVFAFVWSILIGLDYGNKHPGYYFTFAYFRYAFLYLSIGAIIGGSYFLYSKYSSSKKWMTIRGLHIYALLLLMFFIIIYANRNYGETPSSFMDLMHFYSKSVFNASILLLFFSIMRSLGQFVRKRVFTNYILKSFTVDTAIGVMLFTSLLFVLGALSWLSVTSVLLLIFIAAVVNVTYLVGSVKDYLWKPIKVDGIRFMGWASFIFIMFFLSLNFLSTNIPYPAGFDSRNVYVNISKLIAVSGSLAEGFQPYNWSLLMSVGFIMFEYVELALGLSFSAIVLSTIGFYEFSQRFLKIERNIALLALCAFAVTPAVVNQMFVEVKVDFGMLFFQIASIILFFNWINIKDKEINKSSIIPLVLLGLFCGFGMGIKLINMFLVFVLVAMIWWNVKTKYSLVGILLISVSILIFAGVDELSGLEVYHKSIKLTSMICGAAGTALLIFEFVKNRINFIRNLTYTTAFGVALLFMFSPWIGKNYVENKSLSPKTLLLGKAPGPDLNGRDDIVKNYRASKAKQK